MLEPIIAKFNPIESHEVEAFVGELEKAGLKLQPLLAKLMLHRKIDTPSKVQDFLHPALESGYDPYSMKDMDKAISLIEKHINNRGILAVYGDYDVDGITSTTILYKALLACGGTALYYIPDRIEEGYGINEEAILHLQTQGATLIISVDTGITAVKQVDYAKSLGLDIIITDHHECQEFLPKADAVLNPKQEGCAYPFKFLAGVGVTYKLIQALEKHNRLSGEFVLDLLEIVAVGTISDLVPLIDENRTFVYQAFLRMSTIKNIGLKALFSVAGIDPDKISAGVIGFQIGPRLNAAGRLGDAKRGVQLFLTEDVNEALVLAESLDVENKRRRSMEESIFMEADQLVEGILKSADPKILVVAHEGWHHGVIGIVASRITEKYYRPTILLTIEGETASGSARSVDGFSIFDALQSTKELFIKFGGHEMAAGMSLNSDKVDTLSGNLNHYAHTHMTKETLIPKIKVESRVGMDEITIDFIDELKLMEPYGMGNEEPKFLIDGVVTQIELMGKEKNHFKMKLGENPNLGEKRNSEEKIISKKRLPSRGLDAISFYGENYINHLAKNMEVSVIGTLQINEWKSYKNPQLFIKGILYEKKLEQSLNSLQKLALEIFGNEKEKTLGEASGSISLDALIEKLKSEKVVLSRQDCIDVYRGLKFLKSNNHSNLNFARLDLLLGADGNNEFYRNYFRIIAVLTIFKELELITIHMTRNGDIIFDISNSKKVELEQSTLYNRMCCQNN